MNILPTKLEGVYSIEPKIALDNRGEFIKVFHETTFVQAHLETKFVESYYSTSKKNVIRGMHFQTPPQDHTKLVYVTTGAILDVILDIRQGSPTYGEYISLELSDKNRQLVYIPAGFAHGFLAQHDNTCVTYLQTTMHAPEHDAGIQAQSFGMDWGITEPIMSQRDQTFPKFADFISPFTYHTL